MLRNVWNPLCSYSTLHLSGVSGLAKEGIYSKAIVLSQLRIAKDSFNVALPRDKFDGMNSTSPRIARDQAEGVRKPAVTRVPGAHPHWLRTGAHTQASVDYDWGRPQPVLTV